MKEKVVAKASLCEKQSLALVLNRVNLALAPANLPVLAVATALQEVIAQRAVAALLGTAAHQERVAVLIAVVVGIITVAVVALLVAMTAAVVRHEVAADAQAEADKYLARTAPNNRGG